MNKIIQIQYCFYLYTMLGIYIFVITINKNRIRYYIHDDSNKNEDYSEKKQDRLYIFANR